jgi:hypothetical protein
MLANGARHLATLHVPSTLRGFRPEQVSERLRAAIRAMPYHRTATNAILAALFYTIMSVSCISARAQGRLEAQFGITMTGVPIGHIAWHVDIGNNSYETSANGKASGVLSVLINGEGSVATSGRIVDGQLTMEKANFA